MRTTLEIEDDVLEAAKSLARAQKRTVGEVLSDLARRGLEPRLRATKRNGFPIFKVSKGAGPITLEMVKQAAAGLA